MNYDAVKHFEKISLKSKKNDIEIPDIFYAFDLSWALVLSLSRFDVFIVSLIGCSLVYLQPPGIDTSFQVIHITPARDPKQAIFDLRGGFRAAGPVPDCII